MECHHSSDINNLDSLKLMMQHGNYLNVGSKDEKGGGGGGGGSGNRLDDVHGKLSLLEPGGKSNMGLSDKPLPFFGCGFGRFSFVAVFICPPFWYCATVRYFGFYYHPKDPREGAGHVASVQILMQTLISTVIILVSLLVPPSH